MKLRQTAQKLEKNHISGNQTKAEAGKRRTNCPRTTGRAVYAEVARS